MSGSFPLMLHQKIREYTQVFPDFLLLPERKIPRSKLRSTSKERFLCWARRKAQEYWLCIPSIFNEARCKRILLRLPYPCVNAPKREPPRGGSRSSCRHAVDRLSRAGSGASPSSGKNGGESLENPGALCYNRIVAETWPGALPALPVK